MTQIDPHLRYYQASRRDNLTAARSAQLHNRQRRLASPAAFFVMLAIILFVAALLFVIVRASWSNAALPPKSPVTDPSLSAAVTTILQQNTSAQIGVALTDITANQTKTFGLASPFVAASTSKLITACAYYHLAETGRASLTAPLGSYNAEFQIKAMVNQSSNDSWDLLVGAIGKSELQAYAASIGLDYKVDGNTLSPSSMSALLAKLYSGQLLSKAHTAKLLSYMQNTNDDTLIPAALGSNITVYHKYGLLDGELHDAAILVSGDTAYTLTIYTKNTDDSDDKQRTQIIHQLTQAIASILFA